METYAVNINILGRQFPAVVDREEAEVVEKAAQALKAKIKTFKNQYPHQDDLNILIMCSLDLMMEQYKTQKRLEESNYLAEQAASALLEDLKKVVRLAEGS